ncbi:transcription initiation factor TFIID subunit 12b isoform X2 [Elaeis guineensis]|uniref:Transcription initiation factor TFIID subunit 12b isoform X2 n=1 Tax=Elaeis guineensis var. tenera TaxID=51953 RepID=A0A6J0PNT1_ELAGV|nr:transcription initiation factor TFIID subunit 12b isoform X2 [Elaeis guineensis]
MAENSTSPSPRKLLGNPSGGGGGGGDSIATPNPQNSNLPSPQIPPSPSISDLSRISSPQIPQTQPQINPVAPLDYASKQSLQPQSQQQHQLQAQQQQQQSLMSPSTSFQLQQGILRSGSMSRINQIQQQYGAALAASAMRQQHTSAYGGQMNLGGAQIQQQQQQQQMAAGMSRAGTMGQAGQLSMLPGQTAAHLNLQAQMLAQPRQKMGLVQGTQFLPGNSSGQALQGMQTMGVMASLGLNPQLRANGPPSYGQQRFAQGQVRQQQLSQQMALSSSQKLPGQSLPRTPSLAAMSSQLPGLTQNGQSALVQTTLSQQRQQWLKQMQPSMGAPVSPSYHLQQQQRQQQPFLPQQLSSSQLHQKSMGLTQQQISQLVQQQPQLGAQQQQQQQQLLQRQQLQQLLQHQQQQSPRMPGPAPQKSLSLSGSQPETPPSMTGGSSSQGMEATDQLLGKRKIQDLVSQVDPLCKLDPEVEDLLLEMADNFIDSVTTFACSLAKHRKSSTLESKDVMLHLEKNWKLTVPGYTKEEQNHQGKSVRSLMESQQADRDTGVSKGTTKQVASDSASDHPIKASPSSEQLSTPAVGSQMLHKVHRF